MSKSHHFADTHSPRSRPKTAIFWALAGAAIICAAVFAAYYPSIGGGFIWDDELLLTKNRLIEASDGLARIWCTTDPIDYWPVINSSFWIEWRLWETNPIGYHVTNLILHVAGALLIWAVLRRLSVPGAFLAALIFALHPVNVESVAWIAQRKNTLSMVSLLLSILWYLKALRSHGGPWEREQETSSGVTHPSSFIPHPSFYFLSLAAFLLAMLGKGSAAVMPALVLVITWWMRKLTVREFLRTAPFFAVAVVLSVVNIWFQNREVGETIRDAGLLERVLGAGGVVWFYLYKAFWPLNLVFVYPQWYIQTGNLAWWLPLLAAATVTVVLWLYKKTWGRPVLFAWGVFCVSLVPVMGLIDVYFMKYSLVADHYQHIAIIAVIALAAACWSVWRGQSRKARRWAAGLMAVAAAGSLAWLTFQQSATYRDAVTLYRTTLQANPDCWMAHNNLGLVLYTTGRPIEAMEQYRQALHIKPDYPEAENNIGNFLLDYMNRPQEAIRHYLQALQTKPDYDRAHFNLGNAYKALAQYPQAIESYEHAIRLNPYLSEPYNNLGFVLIQTGRSSEAIGFLQQALRLKPNYADAHNNLGVALAQTGKPREAIEHFQQASLCKPDYIDAYNNLAVVYKMLNEPSQAIAAAQKALDIARAQQQTDLAERIENWMKSDLAGSAGSLKTPPISKPATPVQ
jgi:protein O-mannosyl-transferase